MSSRPGDQVHWLKLGDLALGDDTGRRFPGGCSKKVVRILLERGGTVRWEELHNFQRISWRRAPHMINPGSAVVSVTLQLPG